MQILVNIIYYILIIVTSLFLGEVFSIQDPWVFVPMTVIIAIPFSIPTRLLKRYFKNSEYKNHSESFKESIRDFKILLYHELERRVNHYSGKDVVLWQK